MLKKVKILIGYHKPSHLFSDEILTPIWLGSALNKDQFSPDSEENIAFQKILRDDTGDNISDQNGIYNELTAVYWAWKNYEILGNPDYIGLSLYHRHFVFFEKNKKAAYPVTLTDNFLEKIGYSPERIRELLSQNDFVYCNGGEPNVYARFPENHRIKDLNLALRILEEKYPSYTKTAKRFVNDSHSCFGNMFIFPKNIFFSYCEFIFEILQEYRNRTEYPMNRLSISEQLTGIFVQKLIENGQKGLGLSSCFIEEDFHAHIAIPYNEEQPFYSVISIISFLEHAKGSLLHYHVHFLCEKNKKNSDQGLSILQKRYKEHTFDKRDVSLALMKNDIPVSYSKKEYFPLLLGFVLHDIEKILYITDRTICSKQMENFFRLCNLDDFIVLKTQTSSLVCDQNCLMVNAFKLAEVISSNNFSILKTPSEWTFPDFFPENRIGILPTSVISTITDNPVFPKEETRILAQNRACQKYMIVFEKDPPYQKPQGAFSCFWMHIITKIPVGISPVFFPVPDIEITERKRKKMGLLARSFRYLKKNGLKKTIKKILQSL